VGDIYQNIGIEEALRVEKKKKKKKKKQKKKKKGGREKRIKKR